MLGRAVGHDLEERRWRGTNGRHLVEGVAGFVALDGLCAHLDDGLEHARDVGRAQPLVGLGDGLEINVENERAAGAGALGLGFEAGQPFVSEDEFLRQVGELQAAVVQTGAHVLDGLIAFDQACPHGRHRATHALVQKITQVLQRHAVELVQAALRAFGPAGPIRRRHVAGQERLHPIEQHHRQPPVGDAGHGEINVQAIDTPQPVHLDGPLPPPAREHDRRCDG
jgi:hypothetical protein